MNVSGGYYVHVPGRLLKLVQVGSRQNKDNRRSVEPFFKGI